MLLRRGLLGEDALLQAQQAVELLVLLQDVVFDCVMRG